MAWHTPSEVKAAVSGNGNADKAQVTAMITRLLRLPDVAQPADAADALALALCHLWRSPDAGPDRLPPLVRPRADQADPARMAP